MADVDQTNDTEVISGSPEAALNPETNLGLFVVAVEKVLNDEPICHASLVLIEDQATIVIEGGILIGKVLNISMADINISPSDLNNTSLRIHSVRPQESLVVLENQKQVQGSITFEKALFINIPTNLTYNLKDRVLMEKLPRKVRR